MKKRIVVITGATGGIGSALVRKITSRNTFFFLQGNRRFDALLQFQQPLNEITAGCELLRADFGKPDETGRFVETVLERIDRINPESIESIAWVNAAGVDLMTPESKALSFAEKLRLMFEQEVEPAIRLSRRAGQRMKEIARSRQQDTPTEKIRASILFFGWDGVFRGMEGETAQLYGAAKGALIGYAKSLAQELAPFVRVLTISPGWIATTWGKTASPVFEKRGVDESLLGRWGQGEEVADLAAFLLSEKAEYINAQNIEINGGYNCRYKPN